MPGLYNPRNPRMDAEAGYSSAARTASAFDKEKPEPPEMKKTAGGGLAAGASGAAAGASVGAMMAQSGAAGSAAGPWGAAIGAVVGLAAYALS